ncbi:MAG: hypothetical protein PWP32_1411 [Methanothermobacter sp.]|nr:hypothetical protein [Methanothermobacter thermautotrophicus]MDN5374646.1 hypothetical protein [Methanothermobacter sp.]
MLNLDYICMECAQKVINTDKSLENNLRKALGVLQEDGVYAMFLWLEENRKGIRKELTGMLNRREIKECLLDGSSDFPNDFKQFCEKLKEVAEDIDKLLFMKKLIERTLIYSLYHAKTGE